MHPYYQNSRATLYHGDCLSVMPTLGVQVDSVITDPPYHLTSLSRGGSPRQNDPETPFGRTKLGGKGFMGKTWDGGDIAFRPEVWTAALECTKPGGMLLAFGGTRTFHRLACAIEDAGWEIRDTIMWVYGSGFPKSLDVSKAIDKAAGAEREVVGRRTDRAATPKQDFRGGRLMNGVNGGIDCSAITAPATEAAKLWDGWGTALKPAWEPIIVARKPLIGTVAENVLAHGCGALNINGCRIDLNGDYKSKPNGRPSQTGLGDNYDPEKANQPDTVGRWPANVIHDGSDEVLAGFPDTGLSTGGRTIKRSGGGNVGSGKSSEASWSNADPGFGDSGSAARFFYCAKASRSERGEGNKHPTVKPIALMRYLCRLTKTPTVGTVLDPFAGSGSTLIAAALEGREAIGIEQDEGHCAIARDRLTAHCRETQLELVG